MARRKDHTPNELKKMMIDAAYAIIQEKGVQAVTARAIAGDIGYTVGTIYNFYKNLDALILEVNSRTLAHLYVFCEKAIDELPDDITKIRRLAQAYFNFAKKYQHLWKAVFLWTREKPSKTRLSNAYKEQFARLFLLIEKNLQQSLGLSPEAAKKSAKLLWSCIHGITILSLDGKLQTVGATDANAMIEDLINRYFE